MGKPAQKKRRRKHRDRTRKRAFDDASKTEPRRLGVEAAILWGMTGIAWTATAWPALALLLLHRHVHTYAWLVLADVFLPAWAGWMTHEWKQAGRRDG